jgi:glutamate N-acetyltransferase / amino-acid N-acetyltransferase
VEETEFESALTDLCRELALAIVADGEGATKIVTIEVEGARSDRDARLAADAVATSMLVKTALFGNDPNWGRILAAVGRSGAEIETDRIRIAIDGVLLFEKGLPTAIDLAALSARMKQREIHIGVDIGLGASNRTVYTTDLTKEYVAINADYTT